MDVRLHVVDRSRNTFAFFACRLNKDFDFLEILFRSLPGCSISAVTRELSHAFVMQRARSALPEHIHVTSLLRDRPRISFRGSMTLPPNLKT